jgi:hypothetical protein
MLTIKNYYEICGQHVGDEGHKIVGVDELPTQYTIILYDDKNPRFTICLERLGINGDYELWIRQPSPKPSRRVKTKRLKIPKKDIENQWVLLEHMDELLKK